MSKTRFSTTDVRAMVRDLRTVAIGKRVANIYDLNDKTYLFKFATPGITEKIKLLLESGIRFHTTKFTRDLPTIPSPFCMKLRKFIRTKRLESINQLGNDRVVDFKFGSGNTECHIILELYANGNIILTDSNYEVIALLRSHQFDADVSLKVGEIYPLLYTTNIADNNTVQNNDDNAVDETLIHEQKGILNMSANEFKDWCEERLIIFSNSKQTLDQVDKKKKAKPLVIKQILLSKESNISFYGPEIIDHCLHEIQIKPSLHVDTIRALDDEVINNLLALLRDASQLSELLDTQNQPGYIIYKDVNETNKENKREEGLVATIDISSEVIQQHHNYEFIEFIPYLFNQHKDRKYLEFPSFDETVDEFFCKVEDQKLEREARLAEESVRKKVEKVKQEQEKKLKNLENEKQKLERSAMLLELYADEVDKVSLVLNNAISNGMTWDDIHDMVEMEKFNNNPIASLVHKLLLDDNRVVLALKDMVESDSDSDSDKEGTNMKKSVNSNQSHICYVEIDLSMSAFANSRHLYSNRKIAQVKEQKTLSAAQKALQSVEDQAAKSLEKMHIKKSLSATRKVHWFEKFNWFITTEGYLVLSGRDAQQNDALFRRYLKPGDVYVHADLSGAASCIVKSKYDSSVANSAEDNNSYSKYGAKDNAASRSFSPLAIQEAGVMAVCRSAAWSNKIVTSAWWVWANQVSKTAPTGEYLTTGSFMIYGKKNYLPPMSLEMGFGVMFRLNDASVGRHVNDRKDRTNLYEVESVLTDNFDRYNIDMGDLEQETLQNIVEEVEEESNSDNGKVEVSSLDGLLDQNLNDKDSLNAQKDDKDENSIDEMDTTVHNTKIQEKSNDRDDCSDSGDSDSQRLNKKGKSKNQKMSNQDQQDKPHNRNSTKKKTISKKKARRYAEQDEEDRELAMAVLGHGKLKEKEAKITSEINKKELKNKQLKAGIHLLKDDWESLVLLLQPEVSGLIQEMINSLLLKPNDIDSAEIRALASLPTNTALEILVSFRDGKNFHKAGNKSGYLAGIIRKFQTQQASKSNSIVTTSIKSNANNESEVLEIMEEEGINEEEEGKLADEIDKLTGNPLSDDTVLYAIPVCGPYISLNNYKYKVKLTPGNLKKGKACKQILDIFSKAIFNVSAQEKTVIKGISDVEAVAVMIGDVKLSMPGLYTQVKKKKSRGQKG